MQVTPSRIFVGFCLGILSGVFVSTAVAASWTPWALAGLGILFGVFGFPFRAPFGSLRYLPFAVGVLLLGMALGAWRVSGVEMQTERQSVTRFAEEAVTVEGTVPRYPSERIDGIRFWLNVEHVGDETVDGRVLVFADRSAGVAYGDRVAVSGKLRLPESLDGFDYPSYLAKDGIAATLSAKDVAVVGRSGSAVGRSLAVSRATIDRIATSILPFREGALLKALLLGDEGSMTEEFKQALNRSGLRHIVAVSGMNITIITTIIVGAALRVGLWRRQAFGATTVVIAAFVAMIGAPASAARAALMGLAIRAAPLVGRRGSGFRPAVAAAAGMTVLSPLTLVSDIGFQLSFLAVLGIIFLSPMFARWFGRIPGPKIFREALAMTCAAQLAVAPLLLSAFGQVSVIAPLTNLLVVPLLVLVTIWGFAAVGLGALWLPLGSIAAAPLLPYFSFVAWVAEATAALPWSAAALPVVSAWASTAIWYGALGRVAWREAHRDPKPIELALRWKAG